MEKRFGQSLANAPVRNIPNILFTRKRCAVQYGYQKSPLELSFVEQVKRANLIKSL